ncbi:MAG: PGF-pre-PGF domain-containing protein, partial [Candidatus Hadarchaeales archaeon]
MGSEDPGLSGETGPKAWGIGLRAKPPQGWEELGEDGGGVGESFSLLDSWSVGEDLHQAGGSFYPLDSWNVGKDFQRENLSSGWVTLEEWEAGTENWERWARWVSGKARANFGRANRRALARFENLPVRYIELLMRGQARDFEVTAEALDSPPQGVPPANRVGSGEEAVYVGEVQVYSYLDLSTSLQRELLEEAGIGFSVPKSWLEGRGSGRLALWHYGEREWEELPTWKEGEDGASLHFRARSSGFSVYAIVYVKGETVYEGGTSGLSGAQSDDGVYENLYESDSGTPGVENSYLLTIGPVSGTATANDVFASFFNPVGSGRTAVIGRIVIMVNAGGAASRVNFTLRRITNVTGGGTVIQASSVPKKDSRAPDTAMSIRYGPGISVTWAGTADSRLMSVVSPATAGTHQGHQEVVFQQENLVLREGEGIALYQETAGNTNHMIYLLVEWKEVPT